MFQFHIFKVLVRIFRRSLIRDARGISLVQNAPSTTLVTPIRLHLRPTLPTLPTLPALPTLPTLPTVPTLPPPPTLPAVPTYLTYVNNWRAFFCLISLFLI